ncbi:MAG: hypothetical protein AB8H79_07925 [Myxococcota bacterium]
MTERTHSTLVNGERHIWVVSRLWALAADLPVFDYPVDAFSGFDLDIWYGHINTPTVRSVVEHMRRINAADLQYPIVLSETGMVMDGVHRLCRAMVEGKESVRAVQFVTNPEPDRVEGVVERGVEKQPNARVRISGGMQLPSPIMSDAPTSR